MSLVANPRQVARRSAIGAPLPDGGTGSRTDEAPGAGELRGACENARRFAAFCDRLEPTVDLRIPDGVFDRSLLDAATDDDDEPFIWDLI